MASGYMAAVCVQCGRIVTDVNLEVIFYARAGDARHRERRASDARGRLHAVCPTAERLRATVSVDGADVGRARDGFNLLSRK